MKNQKRKAKVLAYNRSIAKKKEKADDLDVLIAGILKLPHGQLQKVLSDEVLTVLEKYSFPEA